MVDCWWDRVERKLQIAAVLHLFYSYRCWVCADAFRIRELYREGRKFRRKVFGIMVVLLN